MAIEELDAAALAFGAFVCCYGIFSFVIKERLYLGEAPLAFVLGVFVGPYGIGQLTKWDGDGEDAAYANKIALGLSRIVIGIQLVLVGVQLPKYYVLHEARSLATLLLPVMGLMWLITAALINWVIPDVPYLAALIIAATATPTDPVLSNSIVKGAFADEFVPARLRNLISAESGCNDGLAWPFLFLAVRLLTVQTTTKALSTWFLSDVIYPVGGAVVLGIVIGVAANAALRIACRHNCIDKESFLLYGPMLGLACIGLGGAFAFDDVLASFVAGNAFTYDDWYRKETEEDEIQNVLDFLLNSIFFAFAGAAVPFSSFNVPELGLTPGRLVLLAALVLFLRRIPPLLLFYRFIPAITDVAEATFVGYFGPIGAGAILYCSLILQELAAGHEGKGTVEERIGTVIRPIVFTLVLMSLLCHTFVIPLVKVAFDRKGVRAVQLPETQRYEHEAAEDEQVERAYEEGEGPAPEENEQDDSSGHRAQPDSRDLEMAEPDTSVHPTLKGRGRQTSTGSIQSIPDAMTDAAYRGHETDSSWNRSSGHKLGPHRHAERQGEQQNEQDCGRLGQRQQP